MFTVYIIVKLVLHVTLNFINHSDPLPCTELQFPCQNETMCEIESNIRGFFCRCAPGYQGENCTEQSVNSCNPDPCQNEGVCVNSIDDYSCTCQEGFTVCNIHNTVIS